MSLTLNLLGTFQATVGEQRLTRFRSDKVRALMAYLAVEGNQPHRRETLASLLWSDVPDATARKNLRTSLYRLRLAIEHKADKSFAERLFTTSNRSVQAHVNGEQGLFWVDVMAFQAALAACESHEHLDLLVCPACLTQLETAVSLYKGELLPGFHLDEADLFDEWLLMKREQLHQQAQSAIDTLIEIHQQRQNFEQVRDYCQRQLELEPWRESAFRQLMLALAHNGQRSAALAQYEKCRQVLWDELGVEPGADTQAVYEQVKVSRGAEKPKRQPALVEKPAVALRPAMPPQNLPARLAPYFGREAERGELKTLLTSPDYRLVTLVGEGGVGKTSLAVETGRDLLADFADGVWLVQLAGLDGMDGSQNGGQRDEAALEDEIATAVSQALSLSLTGKKPPKEQLLTFLRQRRLLLILDNFEHVLDGADIVRDLLQEAPRVSILATSREPLEFLAEAVFPVTGLPLPSAEAGAEDESAYASLQLFADRAQRVMRQFALTAKNRAQVLTVCQLVEGSPLGIELAAATLSKRPLSDLLTSIASSIDALASRRRDLPRRHRSMRAVFDGSWLLLRPEEQQILAQLSVFRSGFSAAAAQAVTGATLHDLETLQDKSLVQSEGNGRFRLHELLRQFAAEKMAEMGLGSIDQQHSSYYLNFVAEQEEPLQGATPQVPAAEIETELDNIRKGWRTAVSSLSAFPAAQAIGNSVKTLGLFYQLRGRYQEAEQAFATAVAQLTQLESDEAMRALARVLVQQAHALIRLARYDEAIAVVKTAVSHTAQTREPSTLGTAYLFWGVALWRQGQFVISEQYLFKAYEIAEQNDLELLFATCQQNLGVIYDAQGRYDDAVEQLQAALLFWQKSQNQKQLGITLNSLGIVAYRQGQLDKARTTFEQSLEINKQLNDRQGQMLTQNNLSTIATDQADYDLAKQYLQNSLEIARHSGEHAGESLIFRNLGWVSYEEQEFDAAQIYLEQALQISERIGDQVGKSITLKIFGDIASVTGAYNDALRYYSDSVLICQEVGNKYQECHGLLGLAKIYRVLDDQVKVNQYAEEAFQLAHKINNHDLKQQAMELLVKISSQASS
ncbi:MAG: tetratricopeptide repeat protein [Chloroflexota bacterium]